MSEGKRAFLCLCAAGFAVSAGTASASGVVPVGDTASERGKAMVERLCSHCHAIGTEGPSSFAQAPPFGEIARRYDVEDLAEAFAEGIEVGHPAMPVFEFSPAMIGDLLAYLRSLE